MPMTSSKAIPTEAMIEAGEKEWDSRRFFSRRSIDKSCCTYILKREPGTSLAAAGWKCIAETPGRSWSVPSRLRDDKHPLEPKMLWEKAA